LLLLLLRFNAPQSSVSCRVGGRDAESSSSVSRPHVSSSDFGAMLECDADHPSGEVGVSSGISSFGRLIGNESSPNADEGLSISNESRRVADEDLFPNARICSLDGMEARIRSTATPESVSSALMP
jgi:hypothetical protein